MFFKKKNLAGTEFWKGRQWRDKMDVQWEKKKKKLKPVRKTWKLYWSPIAFKSQTL